MNLLVVRIIRHAFSASFVSVMYPFVVFDCNMYNVHVIGSNMLRYLSCTLYRAMRLLSLLNKEYTY